MINLTVLPVKRFTSGKPCEWGVYHKNKLVFGHLLTKGAAERLKQVFEALNYIPCVE